MGALEHSRRGQVERVVTLGTGMPSEVACQDQEEGPELRSRGSCAEGPDDLWVQGRKDVVPNLSEELCGFTHQVKQAWAHVCLPDRGLQRNEIKQENCQTNIKPQN